MFYAIALVETQGLTARLARSALPKSRRIR
jgi:hypothetical protein